MKVIFVIALLLMSSLFISSTAYSQIGKWESQAEDAMRSSDYQKAVSLFTKVLENSPKHKTALFGRGMAYLYTAQYEASKGDMSRLVTLDQSNPDAFNVLGLVNGYLGELEAAVDNFTKAVSLDGKFTEAFINRGSAYIALGKNGNALKDFSKAIKLDKSNPSIYFQRARLNYFQGEYKAALKDYNKAIELGLEKPELHKSIGDIHFKQKKYKDAVKSFTKALELNPKYIDALNNRAVAYELLGDESKAKADRKKLNNLTGGKFPLFEELKFVRYKAENDDYSFELPTGWHKHTLNRDGENRMLITPENVKDINSPYYTGISITMIRDMQSKYGVTGDQPMYDFWRASVMKNAEDYAVYNIIQTKKRMLGQYFMHLTQVTLQYSPDMIPLTMYEVTFTKDNELIFAYFQSPEQQFTYYQKIFDEAIKSIIIN